MDVWVNLRRLFPPERVRWGQATPLWLRTAGVPVGEVVPARLKEWCLTSAGDWVGRVSLVVLVDDGELELDQLIPASALQPRSSNE